MNIAWVSNPPWASSGYGQQTDLFARRLHALGHDVSLFANCGLQWIIGEKFWQGMTVYPADNQWGNLTLKTYTEHAKADTVIALCDAWVLQPDAWPDVKASVWAPVDHFPIPPAVLATLAQPNITPIAMSRFGEQQMRDCGLDPLYVPHGYDPQVFKPMPELRDKVRDTLQIPRDAFLVGMVGANKVSSSVHRKSFPQAFHAFANLLRNHPDAYMYAHTRAAPVEGGMDLCELRQMLAIPDDRLIFPADEVWQLGMGPDIVAKLYAAFDVLLMPSMGEGFGIPLIEAQACGCPVITSNHSAMTELGQAGWLVDGDPWWNPAAKAFFIAPFIASITEALECAYMERGDQGRRQAAVEFAAPYNADLVTVDYWLPALERLAPQVESRQVRRARERREAKQAKREQVAA